ncbi:hypothetical protein [Paenibacillus sp. Z6-24]
MLQDAERKVLRVLYNYFAKSRMMPSWVEAPRKIGRDKDQVTMLLNGLANQGYINWDGADLQTVVLLQQPETVWAIQPAQSGSDYFTQY